MLKLHCFSPNHRQLSSLVVFSLVQESSLLLAKRCLFLLSGLVYNSIVDVSLRIYCLNHLREALIESSLVNVKTLGILD